MASPRFLLAAAPAAVVVVAAWALLEQETVWPAFAVAVAAALAPVLVRGTRARALVAGLAVVAVPVLVFGDWPHDALREAWQALREAPAVRAPFDPDRHASLHGLVALMGFGLALVATLGTAARRPTIAAVAVAIGIGVPAVLLEDDHAVLLGAAALAAVMWSSVVIGAAGINRAARGLLIAGALTALACGAAAAGVTPGAAHVDWRGWDPFPDRNRTADIAYVWDANYQGIEFPARPTVVLRIRAPEQAEYWRVSILEQFDGDRWVEELYPIRIEKPGRRLPADPLVPSRDTRPGQWLRQDVTVEGLEEVRIAAASQPARIVGALERVLYLEGGVMRAARTLRRGTRYRVWSFAPRPTPRALAASPPRYPRAATRLLQFGRARLPGYGVAGRERTVDRLFTEDRLRELRPYRPLWDVARRRTARSRSPYEATLLLERWFRRDGGFRYEEQPRQGAGPPLVDFVQVTRAGYCQHYAGAMALMLRMVGIPARVAVGFTAGSWEDGVWTVTDQQAHAWVEAWFAGHGWLAFDPTPGRGTLSAVYTLASNSAAAVAALGTGRFLDFTPGDAPSGSTGVSPAGAGEGNVLPWWLATLLLVSALLVAAGAAVPLAKRARRRRRLRRRDPRMLAAGVRAELVAALADRGAAVGRDVTLAELERTTQRVLSLPAGPLLVALGEARFGPAARAGHAASTARRELGRLLATARSRERLSDRARASLSVRSFQAR